MRDRVVDVLQVVLFGAGGMAVLTVVVMRPMPASESILTALVGASGLFWALTRVLMLRRSPVKVEAKENTAIIR